MTNLAIECSGTAGSVALFDRETPICYSDLDTSFSSVRTLAREIERIMRGRAKPSLISVTNGPGSFTGLRVGLTTAKMLAMAWKVPVVPVDTLQAIALRAHARYHIRSQEIRFWQFSMLFAARFSRRPFSFGSRQERVS